MKSITIVYKKEFAPVVGTPYADGQKFRVGIVNDRLKKVNAELNLRLTDFDGHVIWEVNSLVEIQANSSDDYFDVNYWELLYGKSLLNLVFTSILKEKGKVISKNNYYFRPYKELKISKPKLEYAIVKADNGFDIELKTDKLAI